MRALLIVSVAAMLAAVGAPPEAGASILPQIEEARRLEAEGLAGPSAVTKHYVEVAPGVWTAVKGARERRQVRFARWRDGLAGDRAEIYAREGAPVFRHLELEAGVTREVWTYPDRRLTFVFRGDRVERRGRF